MNSTRRRRKCKIAFGFFLVALNITFIVVAGIEYQALIDFFTIITNWVADNPGVGLMALIFGYIFAITLMMPTSLFLIAIGLEFHNLLGTIPGFLVGLLVGQIITMIGCSLAFFFSRRLLKSAILSYVRRRNYRARAILLALENDGFKLVTLFRLAPIFPFSILNYALGASSVSFKNYLYGSIGIVPKLSLYFYISSSIGSISDAVRESRDDWTQIIILVSLGTFLSIVAGVYVTVVARRELNRILDETENNVIGSESESSRL